MALVVFLRGVNVGGHKTFRPSQLVEQLKKFEAVNIGAAGTFIIRKRVAQSTLRSEIARRLPFESKMAICDGREIVQLIEAAPFGSHPPAADVVRFVSVMLPPGKVPSNVQQRWPETGDWLVRVLDVHPPFIVGEYRRNMKTISYLGGLDKAYGGTMTTRNWNTFNTIAKKLSI